VGDSTSSEVTDVDADRRLESYEPEKVSESGESMDMSKKLLSWASVREAVRDMVGRNRVVGRK
jgi:hypothetical protein